MASSTLRPHTHAALLMPSGLHKVVKVSPNTTISLGKFGSFPSNLIIGRPYHLTFEILDVAPGQTYSDLRVIPASELHAEALSDDSKEDKPAGGSGDDEKFDLIGDNGHYIIRNNRLTVDDTSRQALGMEEIEALKKCINTGSGKDIVAKIMDSHSALGEKTAFSLAKYTLRKSKKYLKRFTLVPLDVNTLADWMLLEKDAARIMDIRHEHLGMLASWSNVHFTTDDPMSTAAGNGRWLVVDESGGLLTAALAERMRLLHHDPEETAQAEGDTPVENGHTNGEEQDNHPGGIERNRQRPRPNPETMSATSNTLTLVHSATQPNLSLLEYFDFDPHTASTHPLHAHLKALTWLQLLDPAATPTYASEPPLLTDEQLAAMKPSKRGTYHRKRRRWQRVVRVVDETRAGGFDGLVVAGVMDAETVLHHLVPLVRGGGQVVVYSPSVEPLAQLCDIYSSARKTAFINLTADQQEPPKLPHEDFPLDPRLLLAPTLQSARAREWQVLPGRTHPLMTGRGGSEGYVFTGTRVLPADGRVAARGVYTKRRKVELPNGATAEEAHATPTCT